MKLIIKNGRVINPASGTDGVMDVLIDGSVIAEIAENLSAPDAEYLDAEG